jgi:hypothetical protein
VREVDKKTTYNRLTTESKTIIFKRLACLTAVGCLPIWVTLITLSIKRDWTEVKILHKNFGKFYFEIFKFIFILSRYLERQNQIVCMVVNYDEHYKL